MGILFLKTLSRWYYYWNHRGETQRRQYEGHNTPLGCHTDQGPQVRGQYDGQGVYCGLSTASEVFIFTTQQYLYLCDYHAIVSYIDKREVLQQEYSQPLILPSLHFRYR